MKRQPYRREPQYYEEMRDEDIVRLVQEEHDMAGADFLVNKYKHMVRQKARSYFMVGADTDDIIQEGMIGLYKATRDFKEDREASFKSFAELCITRQIITAIKAATRQKHQPLNSYISLNGAVHDDGGERTLFEVIEGPKEENPEKSIIIQDESMSIETIMEEVLSSLERQVLQGYLDGKTYQEMSLEVNRSIKSIDNALQRIKKKLEKYFGDRRILF